jgi:hypothetical protein
LGISNVYFFMLASMGSAVAADRASGDVDEELRATLTSQGFTGRVESTLEKRLGRSLDPNKAELGRLLFFVERR